MSSVGAPRHDPVPIGVVAALAAGHLLAPYLRFLASLSDIQHRLQDGLAQPDMPNEGDGKRAREFGMPPLDRGHGARCAHRCDSRRTASRPSVCASGVAGA
ncbi:MAG: formate dehydrogenase accessory protein FdhE, partial [Pseudolabrys sp.]